VWEFIEYVDLVKIRFKQSPEFEVIEEDWSNGEVIAVECGECGYEESPYNREVIVFE
jgi:hypothetical protein